ncbi:MAG: ABC transporter substrate-binding protein [Gammaproteobacteria bacterium]|nr:ABC transporter substrate-binding protein [Gammaproteobacteria bacterium]
MSRDLVERATGAFVKRRISVLKVGSMVTGIHTIRRFVFCIALTLGLSGIAQEIEDSASDDASQAIPAIPGVTEDQILFGQSAAFEGPAAALGRGMNLGIKAAFAEVNATGGVYGRELKLVQRNDGYEPELAIVNSRALLEEDQVFALIGGVGTPTSRAALPIADSAKVPYIAPFTGAGFLRDSTSYSVNLRASYDQETSRIVQYLTDTLNVSRIAVVYQNDSYGQVGLQGVQKAMGALGRELVGIGAYPRNTKAVKTALLDVAKTNPEAIVIIGAYAPTAEFILWAKKLGLDSVFFTISFVGSQALASALGEQGKGVYVSQVVPTPDSKELLIAWQYREALRKHDPLAETGFVSFEGYLAGRMTISLLEEAGRELTRAKFMDAMRNMTFDDLDGFSLQFGETDNQGSDQVFLTMIGDNQTYQAVQ